MAEMKVKIEVQDVDKVNTLIDLLSLRMNELPSDIVAALKDLADCEHCEYNHSKLASMGVDCDLTLTCDDRVVSGVVSANRVLKRITVYKGVFDGDGKHPEIDGDDGFIESFEYPKSFKMVDNKTGLTVMEW